MASMADNTVCESLTDRIAYCIQATSKASDEWTRLPRGGSLEIAGCLPELTELLENIKLQLEKGQIGPRSSERVSTNLRHIKHRLDLLAQLFTQATKSEYPITHDAQIRKAYRELVKYIEYLSLLKMTEVSEDTVPLPTPSSHAKLSSPKQEVDIMESKSAFHPTNHDSHGPRSPSASSVKPFRNSSKDVVELGPKANFPQFTLLPEQSSTSQMTSSHLRNGERYSRTDVQDLSPLFLAAHRGQTSIVQVLLDQGADVNDGGHHVPPSNWSPLCTASKYGHEATVKLLLELGANVHAADHTGWTAIGAASKAGHANVVHRLLQGGANPSVAGRGNWTPLHTAAMYGELKIPP